MKLVGVLKALFVGIVLLAGISFFGESGFTQEDRGEAYPP